MVNENNLIDGRSTDRHPLADSVEELGVYSRGQTVIAVQAQQPGIIITTERGRQTFQAGDWIVTDNPPTRAWMVRAADFAFFTHVTDLPKGSVPKGVGTPGPVERPVSVPRDHGVQRKGKAQQ